MTPKQKYYDNIANTLIQQFNKRSFEAYYCETSEEALEKALRFLTPDSTVAFGGSATLSEIGLINALRASDYTLYDRQAAKTAEEKSVIEQKSFSADYYFMSSNAITLDGQLVNIDGLGNRVSSLIYGPKNVVVIAGMNKLAKDVDTAIDRVQNFAAPPNTVRLNLDTPCSVTGRCHNCLSEDCICCNVVITRKSRIPNRIKIILVGEELGF